MINKDKELIGCIRKGELCNFLEDDNTDIAEISAQQIRELLLETQVNNVRIRGAVISGTLDLRDTLSVEGAPVGGLELIDCVILEPLHLERSHLTYLSLLKSAFTELHAQNCRIEGHVDLGYVYSSEDPESSVFSENPEFIDRIKKIQKPEKTGLSGPDNWWEYETALKTTFDTKQDYQKRGCCQVNLSEASISGSLYLDGCRLVAAEIETIKDTEDKETEKKNDEPIKDPNCPAIILDNAKIEGDCIVCPRLNDSITHSMSGSFLGKFRARNITLMGDFWGSGGIYWGYSGDAVKLQGARIRGGIFFQKVGLTQSKAIIRGTLNFLAAEIENWADLTGLVCLHPAFCLSWLGDYINDTLLNFATATVGSNFQLNIEDKSETSLPQIIDLRSMKVDGDFSISIKNYNEGNRNDDSYLWLNSSEVNGEFRLEGDIGSTIFAKNMHVGGLCSIIAIFRKDIELIGLNAGSDVEFYPTLHKKADLSSIHVRGSLYLSSDLEGDNSYFKVLELVHKITLEDWRNFADSQSGSKNFLYGCLNESPCGLTLKHAVIGKELRIHCLVTRLGDIDTSHINWIGRLYGFIRRSLRLLISAYKKYLPDSLNNHLGNCAKTGLDRLYGIFPKQRIEVIYFSDELSFYPGFYWVRCYVEQKAHGYVASDGLIDCLWNLTEEEIVILGGKSVPIHQLNQKGKLKLETEEQAKDYLRFFCECVWGDKGPFHIYEVPHESDKPEIKNLCSPIKITKEEPKYWIAEAHIINADNVFETTFHITTVPLMRKCCGLIQA